MIADAEMAHLKTLDPNRLLGYFDLLSNPGTDSADELARPVALRNVFRDDVVQRGLDNRLRVASLLPSLALVALYYLGLRFY